MQRITTTPTNKDNNMNPVATAPVADTTEDREVFFSPTVGIRINDGDSILSNIFIAETIEGIPETHISYEDGHLMFLVDKSELAHFLHLAYEYSEKAILVLMDGTYDFEGTDDAGETQLFRAQLMTISETHISK